MKRNRTIERKIERGRTAEDDREETGDRDRR